MRRVLILVAASLVVTGTGLGTLLRAQEDDGPPAPKHTIKEVMKQAHSSKLLNKVVDGTASKEEKDQLLDLYISLFENAPPKGERGDWMRKSGGLLYAAARVSVGREGATEQLKTASNCKACHDVFK